MRDGAVEARGAHNPKVPGATPGPAPTSVLAPPRQTQAQRGTAPGTEGQARIAQVVEHLYDTEKVREFKSLCGYMDSTKKCTRCHEHLPIASFARRTYRSGSVGVQPYCRSCNTEYKRLWLKAAPGRHKANQLWTQYRLRPIDIDHLLEVQRESCALCFRGISDAYDIDHDHSCCPGPVSCGKCIRGLICHGCNIMVRMLEQRQGELGTIEYVTHLVNYVIGRATRVTDIALEEEKHKSSRRSRQNG